MGNSEKILIVDDDPGILEAVKLVLESNNYSVDAHSNVEHLENVAQEQHAPDVILLDMLLSGYDGREICKDLKKRTETRDIPIIMFSAHPSAEGAANASGADAFISKPFTVDELLSVVGSVIDQHKKV